MQLNKFTTLILFLTQIIKKLTEQRQEQHREAYRIVDIKKCEKECKIIFQVIGKNVVVEMTPYEIVADDALLEKFSKKDIRTISFYASKDVNLPVYQISSQELDVETNNVLFKLRKNGTDEVVEGLASQMISNIKMLNDLSVSDVCSISYAAGYEHASIDKK